MANPTDIETLRTGDFQEEPWMALPVPSGTDDELLGTTLNNTYAVERILGEGGMGRVYEARHTRIPQKRVAIKVLHAQFGQNQEFLARFQREAEAAASISHPNVVTVLDVDRTPRGLPYLVCEYLEGIDLADHLKNVGKLQTATAVYIARQLCKALETAHAGGVIHRDLKPQNVFLVGDFREAGPPRPFVKILDFGLSRFDQGSDNQLTKTGVIMGTPSFMPPEQALGHRADHRVDIYGVGAILFTAVTGRPPFDEATPQATVVAVMTSEPPRPRSIEPSVSEHLELVIQRAMAKQPDDRYPDMRALIDALDAVPLSDGAAILHSTAPPAAVAAHRASRLSLDAEADEIQLARPRLVFFLIAAVALLIAAAAIAITGVEQTSGFSFSRTELGLLLLAAGGTSLTPALLWIRSIRQHIWNNSARVLVLLGQVRAAVVAAIAAYGLSILGLHIVDDVLVRFLGEPHVRPLGATWPGWSLLMPLIALTAAAGVVLRRRVVLSTRPGWRRAVGVWALTCFAAILVGAILYAGVRWRASTTKPGAAAMRQLDQS
jgi:serine/threonine-protein kinase